MLRLGSAVLGLVYLAGFALLFSAPGGIGYDWLPIMWRGHALLVLAALGYVALGIGVLVYLRGQDRPFPWAAASCAAAAAVFVAIAAA